MEIEPSAGIRVGGETKQTYRRAGESANTSHKVRQGRSTPRHVPLSVVTKPTGSACNLDCSYCFFLSKELLYNQRTQQMSDEVLESYIRAFLDAHPDGDVTFLWQGGEPTLRGIDFFARAVDRAQQLRRPTQTIHHAIQTNGTLITKQWADFFAQHDFLVGISIDGPASMHNRFRVNRAGRGSHDQVVRGWELLREAGVRCNILCTVHAANQDYPREVYRYFRDTLGAEFIQFIPIVERVEEADLAQAERGWRSPARETDAEGHGEARGRDAAGQMCTAAGECAVEKMRVAAGTGAPEHTHNNRGALLYRQRGSAVTSRSVDPRAYGNFLCEVFDEWIKADVGRVFVQDFDAALAAMFGQASVCVHAPECGNNLAMEFNGDVYACDHWVEPEWLLGNVAAGVAGNSGGDQERGADLGIGGAGLGVGGANAADSGDCSAPDSAQHTFQELVNTARMREFAKKKNAQLPEQCRACSVRRFCNGGCPKDRFVAVPAESEPAADSGNPAAGKPEHALNYLCAGYKHFYETIKPDMVAMARLLRSGRPAADIMQPQVRAQLRPAPMRPASII